MSLSDKSGQKCIRHPNFTKLVDSFRTSSKRSWKTQAFKSARLKKKEMISKPKSRVFGLSSARIYGLDVERSYIEFCRRRLLRGRFFVSSMHNFKIDEEFDVIFSANNGVNFLKDFAQWESTFKTLNEHLNKEGLLARATCLAFLSIARANAKTTQPNLIKSQIY